MSKGGLVVTAFFILIGVMVLFFSAPVIASTPGNISSCQVLDTSGLYALNRSLLNNNVTSFCFNITASHVSLDCQGFSVSNSSLSSVLVYSERINTTVRNCNLTLTQGNLDTGISFFNANNSRIINNTVNSFFRGIQVRYSPSTLIENNTYLFLAASNGNQGIFVEEGVNYTIRNNTLLTPSGTENGLEMGIYVSTINYSVVTGNFFTKNIFNRGLYLLEAGNMTVSNNVFINNSGVNIYPYRLSNSIVDYNRIENVSAGEAFYPSANVNVTYAHNTIIRSTGMLFEDEASYDLNFTNNTFRHVNGNSIYFGNPSDGLVILGNTFQNTSSDSVYLSVGFPNTLIADNIINASGGAAIRLGGGLSDSIIGRNNLTLNAYGLYLTNIINITVVNNTIRNNSIDLFIAQGQNISLIDSDVENYSLTNTITGFKIRKFNIAEILFLRNISGLGANLSRDLDLRSNSVFINSSNLTGFNTSANITLYNISTSFTSPVIYQNGVACPSSSCYNFTSLNAGTVVFNVSGGGSYSVVETSSGGSSGSSGSGSSGGSGGGSGGSGGGSTGQTYVLTESQLRAGYTLTFSTGSKYNFSLSNTQHSVTLLSYNTTTVTVRIASTPMTVYLTPGVMREFDLEPSSAYRIGLRVEQLTASGATLRMSFIPRENTPATPVTTVEKPQEMVPTVETNSRSYYFIGIVVLIVLGLGFYFAKKWHQHRSVHKFWQYK